MNGWKTETIGRRYEVVRYAMLTRRVGGDGHWRGRDNYPTLEEAQQAMEESLKGSRYMNVGGLVVKLGSNQDGMWERKVVRVVKQCEVLAVGVGPL